MNYHKFAVVGLVSLMIVGAGCGAAKEEAKTNTDNNQVQTEQPKTASNAPAGTNTTETIEVVNTTTTGTVATSTMTVTVDETWKSYTNKALSFEFQWPTKGTYAPQWEVTFGKEGDGLISNGCAMDNANMDKSTSGEFCHTMAIEGDGQQFRRDYYVTQKGNQYIVIRLTKNIYQIPQTCKTNGLTVTNGSCKEYNAADYQAELDTIISTFKYTE